MTRRAGNPIAFLLLSCALACSLASAPAATAQVLTWNDISGPQGFSELYELGDGTLYAINEYILSRSFDRGDSWQNIPRPAGPILEFAARGTTTVLAVQVNAINFKQYFLSTDRGNTWTRISTEPSPVHTKLMLSADGTPYALYPVVSKMAVERLVNGVWQRVGVPSYVQNNRGGPTAYTVTAIDDAGHIFIGTLIDGIHSTRDNGMTWTRRLEYRWVSSIAFFRDGRAVIGTVPNGRTVGGVFTSDDAGLTWGILGLTDVNISRLSFDTTGDLLVVSGSGIFRKKAAAIEWLPLGPFDFTYDVLHITRSNKYIATSPGIGLLVSTDSGENWISDGIRHQDIFSVTSAPDGSLLAGTLGKGIFRTTDFGYRWSRMAGAGLPYYFYAFSISGTRIFAGTEKGLYASDDNGLSWTLLTTDLNPGTGDLPVYAVLRNFTGDMFIGTEAGVFRSLDYGATWNPAGLGSSTVQSLGLTNDGVIYAATGSEGIFSSSDGGNQWTSRGLVRSDIQTVAVNDAGHVFAGVSSGIYFSTDAGVTWTRKIFTSGHVHTLLFNGNFNVFAGSSYGLFASSDGGQSWASAGLGGQFVIALAYDKFHAMVAGIYKGGVVRTAEIITGIAEGPGLPSSPSLSQNYPNPFNPATTIDYTVPALSQVTLRVHDILGRVRETLVSGQIPPGSYRATWNGGGYSSGVYFYTITIVPEAAQGSATSTGAYTEIRKMLLMK